jgi:oligoendopeptidase F
VVEHVEHASDPAFWDKGLSLIASMIDELEAMEG